MDSLIEYFWQLGQPSAITCYLHARLLTFDDDPGPDPPSVDCAPLELEFGAEVGDTFKGFDIDDDAATAADLSTLFKNGPGKFSSSANRTPGRMVPGWNQ